MNGWKAGFVTNMAGHGGAARNRSGERKEKKDLNFKIETGTFSRLEVGAPGMGQWGRGEDDSEDLASAAGWLVVIL